MKYLVVVSLLIAVARVDADADVIAAEVCIDGVRHQTEVLYNLTMAWVTSLTVDYNNNHLYFIDDDKPTIFNLNTNEHAVVEGVPSARSLSVDQETHDLYIGTEAGIYKYKPSTGEAERISSKNIHVWSVYFNGVLYYINALDKVSTLKNKHSEKLVDMQYQVYRIVIDNDDVMFFSNSTGLYSRQMDSNPTTLYYNEAFNYNQDQLALDRNGKVYFTSNNGIYEVIKNNATYRKVASIRYPEGLVFDKSNNIIYRYSGAIYRIKPIEEDNITSNCSESPKNEPK